MGVKLDSWCFCKGVGKSEKMKASIFSGKSPSMARISVTGPNGVSSGTGFLIHRNLLLTTHLNLPSISAAETAVVRLHNGVAATLFPHRFFITSSVIDLTIVGLDIVDGDSNSQTQTTQQIHYMKTCTKPNLELGSVVYLLGYASHQELKIGEGKLVVATDNLVKLSTDEMVWSPGSAGFDVQGNLAFMICDPRKLATSPVSNSTSSSSSLKRDSNKTLVMMQFGIPIPVICDWLNQHWEGSLDELTTKPKLPLIRLMSSSQKSERSCTSFTMRRVFKQADSDDVGTPSSSNTRDQTHPCSTLAAEEEKEDNPQGGTHAQGIPTPEIYESRKLTSSPLKKELNQVHLLDINSPPRIPKVTTFLPQLNSPQGSRAMEEEAKTVSKRSDTQVSSTSSVNGALSEVISSSPPPQAHYVYTNHGYSSEEDTTMYSAETAESRNYPTPPTTKREFHHHRDNVVARSQSCVSSSRWGTPQKSLNCRRETLEKQRSFVHGKRLHSQGGATNSQRSNDYYSPTVSSIMKKRNNSSEQPIFRPILRPRGVTSSSRWMF